MCLFAELLQHKNPSQRLRSLRLASIIGEILPVDFHGLWVAVQSNNSPHILKSIPIPHLGLSSDDKRKISTCGSAARGKFLCHHACYFVHRTLEHFSCFVANFHFMYSRLCCSYMEFSFLLSYHVWLISSKYLFGIYKHLWCLKLHANFGAWRTFCCLGSPGIFIILGTYHVFSYTTLLLIPKRFFHFKGS